MSETPSYRCRRHAFVDEETFRLEGDTLVREDKSGTLRWPLKEVSELRLAFDPTRIQLNRYLCTVSFSRRADAVLLSASYRGLAEFEDRSKDYVTFVRALVAAVAAAAPHCRFRAGKKAFGYVASLLFLFAMLVLLGVVLVLTGFSVSEITMTKLALLALLIPTGILYIRKNRPRDFSPTAIPADVLPE